MYEYLILRTIIRFLFPFIFLYGLYIQFHGDYSPGGGFQAGVICASSIFAYVLVHGSESVKKILPFSIFRWLSCIGIFLYSGVGLSSMFLGGKFLDYSVLSTNPILGQHIGIFAIELGVGLTVFSFSMMTLYLLKDRV